MRLKKLEISGFKSFRDKVVFDLPEGISAFVGPNGSGKSNVVDAIRWAMGEQRVKSLRGKKMEDVIFNGSEAVAGAGMAEVTLTLSNENGVFPAPYAEMAEVSLTRRLFRDCDSDYYINNAPCRLLDIREFFMGTGMGGRSYAIIEQNSVTGIIEAKPEEIRYFIEEAAGISKYRSRKEAALRKLEAAQANVTRVHDVLRELKNQLNTLSRQTKKAQAFRDARDELKNAQLLLGLQRCWDLAAKKKEILEKSSKLASDIEQLSATQESLEAESGALKLTILEEGERLASAQENIYAIKNEMSAKEHRITFNKQQVAELLLRRETAMREIAILTEKVATTKETIGANARQMRELSEELAKLLIEIAAAEKLVAQLKEREAELYRTIERIKADYVEAVTAKTNHRNMLLNIAKVCEDLEKRQKRGAGDLEQMRVNWQNAVSAQKSSLLGVEELSIKKATSEEQLREIVRRKVQLKEEIAFTEEDLEEAKARLTQKTSRYESLQEFQRGYSWCSEGAQALLSEKGNTIPADLRQGIVGTISDHIDVAPGFETAIEALLGEKMGAVIVSSWENGLRSIDYIKFSALERSSVIALQAQGRVALPDIPGMKKAMDVVRTNSSSQELVEWLLRDSYIVPNLAEGVLLWQKNGGGNFATPEGDLVVSSGVISGGARPQASLFKNKRELFELAQEKEELVKNIALAEENKKRNGALLEALEEEEALTRQSAHRLATEVEIAIREAQHREKEAKILQQRIDVLLFEKQNIQEELVQAQAGIASEQQGEKESAHKEDILKNELAALQEKWARAKEELAQAQEILTTKKVSIARLQTDIRAREDAVRMQQASLAESENTIAQRTTTINAAAIQAESLTQEEETERACIGELAARYTAMEEEYLLLKQENAAKEQQRIKAEEALRELNRKKEAEQQRKAELQTEYANATYQQESLIESLAEKGYENLTESLANFQGLLPQEIDALSETAEKRKREIDGFGEVNLLAISEYEQAEERHNALAAQEADINDAIQTLQRTITRINNISRRRFAETFAEINVHFQKIFPRLFLGGRGKLSLTNTEDLLETGVDVEIQVPNKKMQSLSLLSGGEKSLSAIALILSLVFYKPSSFLIMDEVDAALDDANVMLFNNILKDVSALSQVLLVTHNRSSMEFAHSLYGISMRHDGTSTSLSVSLNS